MIDFHYSLRCLIRTFCILAICFVLTSCQEEKTTNVKQTIAPTDTSLHMEISETLKDRYIIQIPRFSCTKNSEAINDINTDIDTLLTTLYKNTDNNPDTTPEIRTTNFTSDHYLQSVVYYVEYPLLGSDGDVTSYNYDRINDTRIMLSDALVIAETTLDDLKDEIVDAYSSSTNNTENSAIYGITVDGFTLTDDNHITFYGNIDISENEKNPWSYIFSYDYQTKAFSIIIS